MPLNLSRLNPPQREAVLHADGPLLVLAGAGSGKTSTMSYRIAHLIAERHVPARNILGLSFTRKAAEELKDRVKKLVKSVAGPKAGSGVTVTTFHSLCVRILRAYSDKIGFQKNFTILDRNDQVDILREILRQINIDDRKFDPDTLLFEIGQAKNKFMGVEHATEYFLSNPRLPGDYGVAAASAYPHYQDRLKALNAMDFDDLLFLAVKVLESDPQTLDECNDRYRYLLVDEYQDTNPAQFRLLRLLTDRRQNICVVGDDDQSIYGWRGADSTHILEFTHHYPGARVITLDQNYRSTTTILDAANEVISKNKIRHPKKLWSDKGVGEPITEVVVDDDRTECEFVAEEILKFACTAEEGRRKQIRPWKDFAILYRSNPQSRLFEEALRMRQIPYKLVGSMSFLDYKEIKNVLSYWRLVLNPKDDASARRVVNWPPRGVGRGTIEAVAAHAVAHKLSFFEALSASPEIAPRGAAGAMQFVNLVNELRRRLEEAPVTPEGAATWAKQSLELINVKGAFNEEDEGDPAKIQRRTDNVEELANGLGQLRISEIHETALEKAVEVDGYHLLREYLVRMTLDAMDEKDNEDEKKENKDQVTLLTLHGAKGLEFPIVFMVGMEDGFLPHRRTIEEAQDFSEERRLCYVGITRAKDRLLLTRAKNRIRYGKPVPRERSRFLKDVPESLIVMRNESSIPDLSTKAKQEEHETKVKDFLAQIRARITASP